MKQPQSYLIIIVILFLSTYGYSQQSFDDIKHDTIHFEEGNTEHMQKYLKNIELFKGDRIDSIDILILKNPGSLGQIMMQMRGDRPLTYERLRGYYLKIKNNTQVQRLRTFYETLPILKQTIVDSANWEHDRQIVNRLIKDEQQLKKIKEYVDVYTDSSLTYIQLFALLEQQEQQKEPVGLDDLLREYHIAKIDSLIELSKEIGKPILLYFNGHNVVNARKLEMRVMNKKNIIDHLNEDFIFVNLLVDNRTEISKEDHYYSDRLEKQVTTVGAFNMDYQLKRFNMNRQPFLVVLNAENEVLGTRKYDELKSSEQMLMFLEEMRKEFNN